MDLLFGNIKKKKKNLDAVIFGLDWQEIELAFKQWSLLV